MSVFVLRLGLELVGLVGHTKKSDQCIQCNQLLQGATHGTQ